MSRIEAEAIESELSPPFAVARPGEITAPLVFNSPHSGRIYPRAFLESSKLDALTLRRSEDAYVEELLGFVSALGAPLLYAHFPRAYLDVNREPYELDPALIRDGLPHYANTQSVRVVGGLGTIARIVSESDEIYREPLSLVAALERINRLYAPYHDTLKSLLAEARQAFGLAVLIDCHAVEPDRRTRRDPAGLCAWRPLWHLLQRRADQGRGAIAEIPRLCCGAEQTLRRRLHHRTLRQAACWSSRPSGGDQPLPLYE
jgi:N-formylglutamate amidohydrolase